MSLDIWLNCPCCKDQKHQMNLTYNLAGMWRDAGLNFHTWEENTPCGPHLVEIVTAIERLEADPERYKAMNPPNGWGTYDQLLEALRGMRSVVESHPEYLIHAWC